MCPATRVQAQGIAVGLRRTSGPAVAMGTGTSGHRQQKTGNRRADSGVVATALAIGRVREQPRTIQARLPADPPLRAVRFWTAQCRAQTTDDWASAIGCDFSS